MAEMTMSVRVAMTILPKISGSLSVVGSLYIIVKILTSPRRRKRIHSRLLVGMSILSLIQSTSVYLMDFELTNLDETREDLSTCKIQTILQSAGFGVVIYNAAIAVYYVLIITYNYAEQTMKKIERIMHIIPIVYVIVWAIYTNIGMEFEKGSHACFPVQNGRSTKVMLGVFLITVIISIFVGTMSMLVLYCSVLKRERGNERYSITSESENDVAKRKSNRVRKQVLLYLGGIYISWIFVICGIVYHLATGEIQPIITLLRKIFFPLQGAINVVVYMRPQLKNCMKKRDDTFVSNISIVPEAFMVTTRRNSNLFNRPRQSGTSSSSNRGSAQNTESAYVPRKSTARSFRLAKKTVQSRATSTAGMSNIEELSHHSSVVSEHSGKNNHIMTAEDKEFFERMRKMYSFNSDTGNSQNEVNHTVKIGQEISELNLNHHGKSDVHTENEDKKKNEDENERDIVINLEKVQEIEVGQYPLTKQVSDLDGSLGSHDDSNNEPGSNV